MPLPRDQRAWDAVTELWHLSVGIEAETRPTDLQALERRLLLKARDGGVARLVLDAGRLARQPERAQDRRRGAARLLPAPGPTGVGGAARTARPRLQPPRAGLSRLTAAAQRGRSGRGRPRPRIRPVAAGRWRSSRMGLTDPRGTLLPCGSGRGGASLTGARGSSPSGIVRQQADQPGRYAGASGTRRGRRQRVGAGRARGVTASSGRGGSGDEFSLSPLRAGRPRRRARCAWPGPCARAGRRWPPRSAAGRPPRRCRRCAGRRRCGGR